MKNIYIILIVLVFMSGCSVKNHESKFDEGKNLVNSKPKFEIYNSNLNQKVSYEKLLFDLKNSDIVMLGEVHTNPNHHYFQNKIINDLNDDTRVVFEMIDTDKQSVVNLAKARKSSISKQELPHKIKWQKDWNYALYKDIIESVFYSDKKMIAGNLTKNEINSIYKKSPNLVDELSTSNLVKDSLKSVIKRSHGEFMSNSSGEMLDKMALVQIHKDRRMAEKLLEDDSLSVFLAGRFHTDKSLGVPLHIKDFTKSKRIIVIGLGYKDEILDKNSKNSVDF